MKSFLQAFFGRCAVAASRFATHLRLFAFWRDRPIRQQPQIHTGLRPVKSFYNPLLARRFFPNIVCEFNGSPTAAPCGFSRTLFAANGFPASAAFDVLQRGRPICPPQIRRRRTADEPNSATCGEPKKKPWLREKFTNFADIFPEYYV